jgi:uncharacterized protein (TIGR02145 family)
MNKTPPRFIAAALAVTVFVLAGDTHAQTAGTFTDARDGKTYRTVKIGEQVWMAENLNYETDSSWCYDNKNFNCKKYGRLYTWDAAMKACPVGWHLPTRQEWNELVSFAGGDNAGTKLKSKSPNWDGTDDYGFSALPGGIRGIRGLVGTFGGLGADGYWWTATEYDASYAWFRDMYTGYTDVNENGDDKGNGLSVRCLRD